MESIIETNCFGNFKQVDDPKVLIIPTPYEYTTFFNKGTKNAPQAILNSSIRLESFDDELWHDISTLGINTSKFVKCEFVNNKSSEPYLELKQAVRNAVISGCLPVVIGGENIISYGPIKAIYDLYPDVSVLQFNANPNLKSSWQNNTYASPCTTRRLVETMPDLKIIQIGIKSISKEETEYLEKTNTSFEIFFTKDKSRWNISDILSNLSKNIYISFNFNVLDSGIMPSVHLPEPGGLTFDHTLDILKNICTFKEVVGMDFVDFTPIPGLLAPDLLASKLIYKTIGYTFARQLGVFEEKEKDGILLSS